MSTYDESKHARGGNPANTGEYSAKANSAPEEGVLASAIPEKVNVQVSLQRWFDDHAVEVGVEEFDARAILDAVPLDSYDPEQMDNDWVFREAERLGLVSHDGPFTVDLNNDDVREYEAARRAAHGNDPIGRKARRTAEQLDAALEASNQAIEEAHYAHYLASKEGVEASVLSVLPNAATIEVYNAGEDDGESWAQVFAVRDAAGEVIWVKDAVIDTDGELGGAQEYAAGLDHNRDYPTSWTIE